MTLGHAASFIGRCLAAVGPSSTGENHSISVYLSPFPIFFVTRPWRILENTYPVADFKFGAKCLGQF
eukprot:466726-Amphidinium_carterae.1